MINFCLVFQQSYGGLGRLGGKVVRVVGLVREVRWFGRFGW